MFSTPIFVRRNIVSCRKIPFRLSIVKKKIGFGAGAKFLCRFIIVGCLVVIVHSDCCDNGSNPNSPFHCTDEALADYQKVLLVDPKHVEANRAVRRLPAKIEERNERLKAEMMDSLKKLGNMVLKPFGLSTENFKMDQDPSTGGYNIKFGQNK